jgi:hypothetical protein
LPVGVAQLETLGISTRTVKRKFTWLVVIIGLLLIAAAIQRSFASPLFDTKRDWQFVQSVGGMAIGTPHRDDRKHVILPIRCSVAGETVTRHPTTGYSGLAFDTPAVRVSSTNVFLTFRTTLPGKRDAQCPPADLGKLAGGEYAVFYRSPDGAREPVGTIHIPDL